MTVPPSIVPPPRQGAGGSRRAALLLAVGLGGCSVLPNRPYQEAQRFTLAPDRPPGPPPGPPLGRRGPVLLLRTLRAAPGLDQRGLRILGSGGEVRQEYWAEWAAPGDLVEEALRRWLLASGRFTAVTAPGSRLPAVLILEAELTRLQADAVTGQARASLSVLLLADGGGENRVLGQFLADGSAPLAGGARADGKVVAAEAAAAMTVALGTALASLEQQLAAALPDATAAAKGRR